MTPFNKMDTKEPCILVIDDDPGIVRVLIQILKGMGKIHFTTKGTEAVKLALECKPDLIMLDIEMPDINGIEVCKQLKSDPVLNNIPILHVTAHTDLETEALALSSGAIDFIHKPPNPAVVRARVRNYLAMKQQNDKLRLLSSLDGLTGIANRRIFDETLDHEWLRTCRNGFPLSLLMIDVDNFKSYNDLYGHLAGDECLITIAQILKSCVKRPGELVARYGGEEFVVLAPHCSADQALKLAEMIRSEIVSKAINHEASDTEAFITISIGVACSTTFDLGLHEGQASSNLTKAVDLLQLADKALYNAKKLGRNRVSTKEDNHN